LASAKARSITVDLMMSRIIRQVGGSWLKAKNCYPNFELFQNPKMLKPKHCEVLRSQDEVAQKSLKSETVRGFSHRSPLSPYQLLSLRSFVDRGCRIELFTYDPKIVVPSWITRRDANEVWPTDHVLHYHTEPGRGSPALHANLFRYAMLHIFGGWWVDLDVILLNPTLPTDELFFAVENEPYFNIAVLKFPRGHPLLSEAVERCVAAGENEPIFGETGPLLFTELVTKYRLAKLAQPAAAAYPILGSEVSALLDPDKREALVKRCKGAKFIHLYNELWRRSGIPSNLAPPAGSFLEALFEEHQIDAGFSARLEFSNVKRWTAHLFLHEEFQNETSSISIGTPGT
jgi:hypothetical protein